jgi:hypothetical protein
MRGSKERKVCVCEKPYVFIQAPECRKSIAELQAAGIRRGGTFFSAEPYPSVIFFTLMNYLKDLIAVSDPPRSGRSRPPASSHCAEPKQPLIPGAPQKVVQYHPREYESSIRFLCFRLIDVGFLLPSFCKVSYFAAFRPRPARIPNSSA